MNQPVRVAVIGAAGKMGRAIMRILLDTPGAVLAAAVDRAGAPEIGQTAAALTGVALGPVICKSDLPTRGEADVWIDFSSIATTVSVANAAATAGAALVVGTTGLGSAEKRQIADVAHAVPVVLSPNMSVGVNVLLQLVADAARALGPDYDLEMVETHHRMKKDAPSGTALRLAEVLAEATGRDLDKTAVYARKGDVGARTAAEIGIQTLRGGDVVGDHTVFFFGLGDRIEITHRASSRDTFAHGAVRAAVWLHGRKPGLYDMRAVLGLNQKSA